MDAVKKLRRRGGLPERMLRAAIRRMTVAASDAVSYIFDGVEDFDGNVEKQEAEVFTTGTWYRPKAGANAEAVIVLAGGESGHPMAIALRDEAVRSAVANAIAAGEGERVDFGPSESVIYWRSDGTVEIRSKDGQAVRLARHDTLVALAKAFVEWVVVPTDGGGALKAKLTALIGQAGPVFVESTALWPVGTTKLKGE